nr:thioredoxin domain-containing protein [Planomicrobium okeanokoites]
MGPVVSNVAEQVDSVDFYKVVVSEAPELAEQFGIMSIPTLVLVKNGEEVKRSVGFMPEEPLKEFALT